MSEKQRASRTTRYTARAALAIAIVALLLGAGLGLGFGISNLERIQALERNANSALIDQRTLEGEILELAMVSGNTTQLEPVYTERLSGTVDWSVRADFANTEVVTGGTYRLRDVRIGPLNFTLLELSAPPAGYTFPAPGFGSEYEFNIINFTPSVVPTPVGTESSLTFPLTQGNVDRVSVTNGCLASGACGLGANAGETAGPFSVRFQNGASDPSGFTVRFFVGPSTLPLQGETLQFSEPWMFAISSL